MSNAPHGLAPAGYCPTGVVSPTLTAEVAQFLRRWLIAPWIASAIVSACGFLPLGFGRESPGADPVSDSTIGRTQPHLPRKPLTTGWFPLPTGICPASQCRGASLASRLHEGRVLLVGHRILADVKLRQGEPMLGLLIGGCILVHFRIAAHQEFAGGNADELDVNRRFDGEKIHVPVRPTVGCQVQPWEWPAGTAGACVMVLGTSRAVAGCAVCASARGAAGRCASGGPLALSSSVKSAANPAR